MITVRLAMIAEYSEIEKFVADFELYELPL